MSDSAGQAAIDAARAYEELMVPALFAEWASKVAEAAQVQAGERVLDVACGTGILARRVISMTGPVGFVAGIDCSPGMLEWAGQLEPAVEWRQGVAESLPFADHSFDVVVSQFGLMFFEDPAESLREALRVLSPDGRLAYAVWDSVENIPAYAAEVELLERLAGTRAADALRAPFTLGDRQELAALFAGAGVRSVEVRTGRGTARFPNLQVMVEADLRGWLPMMGIVLTEDQVAAVVEQAEKVLRGHVTPEGRVEFEVSAHVVTGLKA